MASTNDQGPSGQIQRLQDEITNEVNADAQHIATSVFGKPGNMPDMQKMTDQELDSKYRNAYLNGDRQWLVQESQRDPNQFEKVIQRLGVLLPEDIPPMPPPPAPPPPPLPPPVAAPAPPLPPGVAPAPAPIQPPASVNLGQVISPGQLQAPLTAPPVTQGI